MQMGLPAQIADIVGTPDWHGHVALITLATDVDDEGQMATRWLVVTERELAVIAEADNEHAEAQLVRKLPLAEIGGFRVQAEIGCGYLQVLLDGLWTDVLRFTNRLAPAFREAARKLELLREQQEFTLEADDRNVDCPRCGRGMSAGPNRCRHCAASRVTLGRVLGILRPYTGKTLLIVALSVAAVAVEMAPPILQKLLVDNILAAEQGPAPAQQLTTLMAVIVLVLLAVRLVSGVLTVIKAKLSSQVGTRLTADLRSKMVDKLQRLSVAYHDRNQVGVLMTRVVYDTEAMHTFMYQLSSGAALQVLQLSAIGVMLFVLNPKLALLTLLPMPLVLAAHRFFYPYLYPRYHRYWDAVGRQAAALTSMLSGIRVVKAFTQERRESQRFQESSERLRDSRVSVDLATAAFSAGVAFIFGLGGLVVWYVGGRDVLEREMTLGSLMAFLAYLSMFYAPLTMLTESATWISSFLTASQRIFELLDSTAAIDEPARPEPLDRVRGHIRFERVHFSYDDKQPALSDVNLDIRPGEFVGIVGRSGSGKSTLASLISRLYDVSSGSVTIDGVDVRRMCSRELRQRVGIVLQEPFLFEGTVAANIVYGNPEATPEQIIAGAKAAAAHDFIVRMPFAYDTLLGERGSGLSGGERQRLSIARAVLYDPQILILDEATSSVDIESERAIRAALERFTVGRTTLAIAHRLSTLESADRLLVLDQGRLVEEGSHHELVKAGGVYAKLVGIQAPAASRRLAAALAWGDGAAGSADGEAVDLEVTPDFDEPADAETTAQPWDLRWLDPHRVRFASHEHGVLSLATDGKQLRGVSVVRAFPASYSEEFLSVRHVNGAGGAYEVGMIRRLAEWPKPTQDLVRRSLNRRYLLRVLSRLVSLREQADLVECVASSNDGTVTLYVRPRDGSVKRFGPHGRLLVDIDDNHYLIPDLEMLPSFERRVFRRYFAD